MPYISVLGSNFEKRLSYLKSASPNLSCCKVWCKNKNPQIRDQECLIEYYWAGIWKWYCIIWNQHPRICLSEKLREKTRTPKLRIKNALFGYFGLEFQNLLSYLKSISSNLSNCKISQKKKSKFGNKNPLFKNALFGYFWARI